MDEDAIKEYLDVRVKPTKYPVTVYLTQDEIDSVDTVVANLESTRTAVFAAMINIIINGEKNA